MSANFTHRDRHGKYTLWVDGNIVHSKVLGIIGKGVAAHFDQHLRTLASVLKQQHWAYAADLSECEGYTPEAVSVLVATHQWAVQHGCIADAYQIFSPLLLNQTQVLHHSIGLKDDIHPRIFDASSACVSYLKSILLKSS